MHGPAFTIRIFPYGRAIYLGDRNFYMVSTFLTARRAKWHNLTED